jgi:hypothetical protein
MCSYVNYCALSRRFGLDKCGKHKNYFLITRPNQFSAFL